MSDIEQTTKKEGAGGWDAQSYHRVAAPQAMWGRQLIGRCEWREDDTVIDAGCGSGTLALEILRRIPKGRLIAFDFDAAMVAKAREVLSEALEAGRAEVRQADALEFMPDGPADVVFSNATFHWVLDHDRLWAQCARWLKPGGRLYVQCGGAGNLAPQIELVKTIASEEPFAPYADRLERPSTYATAEETAARLREAGFVEIDATLEPREAKFATPEDFEAFARTVFLRPYGAVLPEELWEHLRRQWIDAALRTRGPVLNYVRLTVFARRAAG